MKIKVMEATLKESKNSQQETTRNKLPKVKQKFF